jgi:glucose/mannose transport system substrate-binding protein
MSMTLSAVLQRALVVTILLVGTPAIAGEVEVLHYWTSGGEAKSVAELKASMAQRGHSWKDFTVPGGGGQNAMAVLRERVLQGHPPAAANIKGPAIQEWAALNALTNLDAMASFDRWDDVLPKVVADQMKHKGRYVAVPVNVHRVNWLWANAAVLRKAGVASAPRNFDEFFAAADRIRAAGFIPVAHGGQDWQDFTLFESIVLGVGGPALYTSALVNLEPAALSGDALRRSLELMRRIKPYTDAASPGRDWNLTTELVIGGKAGFQFMGDWAKGEFIAAGQTPGKDFLCVPAPGTAEAYTYNVDSFAMFQLKGWEAQKAQGYLAYLLMGKDFQERFNLRKGSIPVRLNMSLDRFDDCAKVSARDFAATSRSGALVPSVAHGMVLTPAQQASMRKLVSDFWNNDKLTVSEVQSQLTALSAPSQKSY